MRIISIVATLMFLGVAACTTTSAPEVGIYNGKQVTVRAELEPAAFNAKLRVFVQNTLAVDATTKAFGGTSQSFHGNWEGKPVIARMTLIRNLFSTYRQLDVFISGQLVETLTL